jgi:hypothetical protein
LDGLSQRFFFNSIQDERDEKKYGEDPQKNKKNEVMMVIEFSDPLSGEIERIFLKRCFRESFPSF